MGLCLVTGGAGFIGSHLVEALVRAGERVRIIDNLATGRIANLASVISEIEFFQGDLAAPTAAQQASAGVDLVFHLAALPSVQRSVDDPIATHQAGATATLNLLEAARKARVRRLVYASSSSVYGGINNEDGQNEKMVPAPRSPYAAAKLAGEIYCQAFAACYGLDTVALRLFNVFGPRQRPDTAYAGAVPRFCSLMLKGEPPVIWGDGLQSRDFTFVDNVIRAFLQASKAHRITEKVYNIGTGQSTSIVDIVNQVNTFLGTSIKPTFLPSNPGDVYSSKADISQAKRDLQYMVTIPFVEGLGKTLEWLANAANLHFPASQS